MPVFQDHTLQIWDLDVRKLRLIRKGPTTEARLLLQVLRGHKYWVWHANRPISRCSMRSQTWRLARTACYWHLRARTSRSRRGLWIRVSASGGREVWTPTNGGCKAGLGPIGSRFGGWEP